MSDRVFTWSGAVTALLALTGLGVYFGVVGLDRADKLASVIGAFAALAGLGLAVYGMIRQQRRNPPMPSSSPVPRPAGQPPQANKHTNIARDYATQYVVIDGTMNIHNDGPAPPRSTRR